MRDEKIFQMRDQEAKRLAMLYRQVQFIQTRVDAYEKVLSTTSAVFKAFLNRSWLKYEVDRMQMELLKEHDEMIKASVEKAKEEAKKTKLTIVSGNGLSIAVFLFIAMSIFSGCVTKQTYNKGMKESYQAGFKDADQECIQLQKKYVSYIDTLKERLKRFNQIDENGELRKLKKFEGDVSDGGWDDPKGNEPWMK